MITPALEKLILSGNASYNTFVIGGSDKSILNVSNNRFIVITDITYFHQVNLLEDEAPYIVQRDLLNLLNERLNTQLRIFSKKSNNLFLFRNHLNITQSHFSANYFVTANGQTHLSTYLVHDQDVSFSFCAAGDQVTVVNGFSPAESIGFAPPFDFGLQGQPGALIVPQVTKFNLSNTRSVPAGNKYKNLPVQASFEFMTDFNAGNKLQNLDNASAYPIVLVGYVEVNGTPTNIGATL